MADTQTQLRDGETQLDAAREDLAHLRTQLELEWRNTYNDGRFPNATGFKRMMRYVDGISEGSLEQKRFIEANNNNAARFAASPREVNNA